MKLFGFLLLLAGWGIVLAALALLTRGGPPRAAFVIAGMGVEAVGVVIVMRAHRAARGESE